MEKKKFEEYTKEEKLRILEFWFYYYGKDLVTLDEIHQFDLLAEEKPDRIFDYITVSYLVNETVAPSVLLQAMRSERLDELFDSLRPKKPLSEGMQKLYDLTSKTVFEAIIDDFNNPEPAIPMDIDIYVVEDKPKQK